MGKPKTCPACGAYQGPLPEHPCPAYRQEPALTDTPTDTSFIREARNQPEGLRRYRRSIR